MQNHFGDIDLSVITSQDILAFMSKISDGTKQNTKKLRFTLLSAFFNFVKNSLDPDFHNPCDNPALRKFFRGEKPGQLKTLEKETVDEIIFRTQNPRNRLMLELMARSGMRVGEVLKLTPMDVEDRKAIIRNPKSGKEVEAVFLPLKVADRLRGYIRSNLNIIGYIPVYFRICLYSELLATASSLRSPRRPRTVLEGLTIWLLGSFLLDLPNNTENILHLQDVALKLNTLASNPHL